MPVCAVSFSVTWQYRLLFAQERPFLPCGWFFCRPSPALRFCYRWASCAAVPVPTSVCGVPRRLFAAILHPEAAVPQFAGVQLSVPAWFAACFRIVCWWCLCQSIQVPASLSFLPCISCKSYAHRAWLADKRQCRILPLSLMSGQAAACGYLAAAGQLLFSVKLSLCQYLLYDSVKWGIVKHLYKILRFNFL